jgi:hypothetical protein
MHVDSFEDFGKSQDGIAAPIAAVDTSAVEGDRFM